MKKLCLHRLPTLKVSCFIIVLLLASLISEQMETATTAQLWDTKQSVPRRWKTYTDTLHGFSISYPPDYYQSTKRPAFAGLITLQHRRLDAQIFIYVDIPFDLQKFVKQAPTGYEDPPQPVQAGGKTFYYYGPGGGGVTYADHYFFNLRGKTLNITFDGPYIHDKTPSKETKALEPAVLASLRVFK